MYNFVSYASLEGDKYFLNLFFVEVIIMDLNKTAVYHIGSIEIPV